MCFEPDWLRRDAMEVAVVLIAPLALIWAASTAMLGSVAPCLRAGDQSPDSELAREAESALEHATRGDRGRAVLAFVLVIPGDVLFLAGVYAFGALLAIAIAHALDHPAALHRSRTDAAVPGAAERSLARRASLPLPAMFGCVLTVLAWVSVIVFHERRPLPRRGLDAVRPRRVRRLPARWSRARR